MPRPLPPSFLFVLLAPLAAQQPESPDTLRRLLTTLSFEEVAQFDRIRAVRQCFRMAQISAGSHTATLVMPEGGDVVRLRHRNAFELVREGPGGTDETCGRWNPIYPGSFTALAVGPNDIVVAMETTNASPRTTVLCFSRPDRAHDFVMSAWAAVDLVAWTDPEHVTGGAVAPQGGEVIAWDAASRTVTMAFPWPGLGRCALGDVELASTSTAAQPGDAPNRRRRPNPWPVGRLVRASLLGGGTGVDALSVNGELCVFERRPDGPGRAGPMRVHVRDRKGRWSQPPVDVPGVRLEPEFMVWQDEEWRVCVTTPVSDAASPAAEPVQTLRTFRMDPNDRTKWTPAPMQFAWSGRLRQGQRLRIVNVPDAPPAVVLLTQAGEVVEQRAAETPRDK